MHARSFSLCAAALLLAAPLGAAHAQSESSDSPSRFALEGYLAQYSFDTGDDRTGVGGVGVRLMFGHSDATSLLATFFQRARGGVFLTYTGEQKDVQTLHFGAEADFPLFAGRPMRLDPFVSLGAGIFRTSIDQLDEDNSTSDFALTPAIGTLFPITGSIAFRGDIRDVIIFGDNTTNNWVAEGGISIGF